MICQAFAAGCGGHVERVRILQPGPAAFYGVVGLEPLFREAKARAQDWYYIDNSFFDVSRGTYYRIARNRLQEEASRPDYARLHKLGLKITPWHKRGEHVLVVATSDHFMREIAGWPGGIAKWKRDVLAELKRRTDRPIILREWRGDKIALAKSLPDALENAWALVTHSSAAANEALLAGVPVFVTDPNCAAARLAGHGLEVEHPLRPEGREEWAARLAARQWTLEEIRCGMAWRELGN